MDDDLRRTLFDPADAHLLVLARRSDACSAVACVVSDVVWAEVVGLLRWAAAGTSGAAGLDEGRWWRLAGGCADLLRRLPALCDEVGESYLSSIALGDQPLSGVERVERASERLAALLRSPEPVPYQRLADEIDALGAAAISALAERSDWAVPSPACSWVQGQSGSVRAATSSPPEKP
jgi:hypothetical protein